MQVMSDKKDFVEVKIALEKNRDKTVAVNAAAKTAATIPTEILHRLRDSLRDKMRKRLRRDKGYNVTLMMAGWDIEENYQNDVEFFNTTFYQDRPVLICDCKHNYWVYGMNQDGIPELKKLNIPQEFLKKYEELFEAKLKEFKDEDAKERDEADKKTAGDFTTVNTSSTITTDNVNDPNSLKADVLGSNEPKSDKPDEDYPDNDYYFGSINGREVPTFIFEHLSGAGIVSDPHEHFEHFPKAIFESNEQRKNVIENMEKFIASDPLLEQLLMDFFEIGQQFTEQDLESLGTGAKESPLAKRFSTLYQALQENGFYGTRGEKINFWSGSYAMEIAQLRNDELSSTKIPSFMLIWLIHDLMSEAEYEITYSFACAISKCFSINAKGAVNVYISSDKTSEEAGLKVHNYFWSVELPTLQKKLKSGDEVISIHVHLYNAAQKRWEPPIDINSEQADLLPVYRRAAYQPPLNQLKDKVSRIFIKKMEHMVEVGEKARAFEAGQGASKSYNAREKSPPRKPILFGKIKNLIRYWEYQANKKALYHLIEKQKTDDPNKQLDPELQADIVAHQHKDLLLKMRVHPPGKRLGAKKD